MRVTIQVGGSEKEIYVIGVTLSSRAHVDMMVKALHAVADEVFGPKNEEPSKDKNGADNNKK